MTEGPDAGKLALLDFGLVAEIPPQDRAAMVSATIHLVSALVHPGCVWVITHAQYSHLLKCALQGSYVPQLNQHGVASPAEQHAATGLCTAVAVYGGACRLCMLTLMLTALPVCLPACVPAAGQPQLGSSD